MAVFTVSRGSGIDAELLLRSYANHHNMTIFSQEIFKEVAKISHQPIDEIKKMYDMDSFSSLKVFVAEMLQSFGRAGAYPMPGAAMDSSYLTPYIVTDTNADDAKSYVNALNSIITAVAQKGNVFIIGRGAQCICANIPECVHIRLVGEHEACIGRIKQQLSITAEEAQHMFKKTEKNRAEYLEYFFNADITDPSLYDAIINIDRCSQKCLEQLLDALSR